QATLSDGRNSGTLALEGGVLTANLPALDLGAFQTSGVSGTVAATGRFTLAADALQSPGEAILNFANLKTPWRVPDLGWNLDGTGDLTYRKQDGQVPSLKAAFDGSAGHLEADFKPATASPTAAWTGTATFNLRGFDNQGTIQGNLTLGAGGLSGQATAAGLKVRAAGVTAILDAKGTLKGDSIEATGSGSALGGRVQGSVTAGLSGLWPGARALFGSALGTAEPAPLAVQARFDAVQASSFKPLHDLAPFLNGRASGVVQASESLMTIALSVPEASWPDAEATTGRVTLPLRLNATVAGTDLRADGSLGDSTFTASSSAGVILGQADLRYAPLHALIGSVTGPLPGAAFVTGLARFSIPMDHPADGSLRLALVRADLRAGDGNPVQVQGGGSLTFGRGGLEVDNLHFTGAGTWTVSGRYKPDAVDLKLVMQDASLTPVLSLVPALKDLKPRANGTATLQLSGRYGAPDFGLSVQNLTGEVQGQALTIPSLTASLKGSTLAVNGAITAGGGVGGSLGLQARATVDRDGTTGLRDVSGLVTGYADVAPAGRFDGLVAQLTSNASGGVDVHATARKGGPVTVDGSLYPRLNLRVVGTGVTLAMPSVYVQDSLSNLDLTLGADANGIVVGGNVVITRLLGTLNAPAAPSGNATTPVPTDGSTPAPADTSANPTREAALSRIRFDDVHISAVNGIRISEAILNTELGGNLTLAGTGANPTLSGSVEALAHGSGSAGTLVLGGNTFQLNSGVATFNPADGALPVITAQGTSDIHTQLTPLGAAAGTLKGATVHTTLDVTVNFEHAPDGSLKVRLDTHLSGYVVEPGFPALTEQDLYGLVALGSNGAGLSLPGLSENALNTALDLFVFNEVQRAFTSATGINLQISTNLLDLSETDRTIQAAFTFGGYLGRQLYLEY
ncbi:MAG TPA: translocation/assembly module TamB domain-containing protein, partial [Deinococcales bacterium]|nr:translocation/assembly module TamB domain-containing protein [Deinococcales bacterium]